MRKNSPCHRTLWAAAGLLLTPRGFAAWALLALLAGTASAQTTGSILGRVLDGDTGEPLAGAEVRVLQPPLRTIAAEDGRFILVAVPTGQRSVRVERIGYRTTTLEAVLVRASRTTELRVELKASAVAIEGVVVEGGGIRLIEPDVHVTHDVVLGHELRELPVDRMAEAIELAPGVSDGHFRGGRVGQEVYVLDGLVVKNPLEASTQGFGLELAPSSLDEVEVLTGGFGAEYGSALSGVVNLVTRRGDPERWRGRASLLTDHWAPASLFRGFTGLSASAGGPLRFLGSGTTLFVDLLAQGMLDAEPRARGLTCLEPADVDSTFAAEIERIREGFATRGLHCPYTAPALPFQRGDKLIGFLRFDRPLSSELGLTATLLRNRFERELFTPEFKYNRDYQLGQRNIGTLATLALDWSRHRRGSAYHVTARAAAMRIDRHLGALDPWTFRDRFRVAGFGAADFRFLGEDFVRRPINDQLAEARAVPGYLRPGGATGSPFGPAAEGIFSTSGTPDIANWSRSDFLAADLVGEYFSARGASLRTGGSSKFYRIESYERTDSHLPGSAPNYARFYPATVSSFLETRLLTEEDDITVELGVRLEGFRSGLSFRADRGDFLAPTIDTEWNLFVMPRLGAAMPIPGTRGRTVARFNYGRVAQPPDFRYFLDTTIGDSLRTDIQRQGNPALSFERGAAYEVGLSQLLGESVALSAAYFRKELTNLVAGNVPLAGVREGQFSTADFGEVQGLELSLRGSWRLLTVRAGYALQRAQGTVSTALDDSIGDPDAARETLPLAFDRRHSADLAIFTGRASGATARWGAALTATVQAGYPLDRRAAAGDTLLLDRPTYLPWTAVLDARASFELGSVPGCARCAWGIVADARNLLGRENVLALRRENGRVGPPLEQVLALARTQPLPEPIPFESPRYSRAADLDGDGLITDVEYQTVRRAAALDRFDPSLFFGEARQVRFGVEMTF